MAGRARRACDDGGRAAGRVFAARRHSRYLRAGCGRPGADRAVRRRRRIDSPVRRGDAAEPRRRSRRRRSRCSSRRRRTGRTSRLICRRRRGSCSIEPNELAGGGQVLSGADGSAAGVSLGADDAGGDLQVSVGDGGGRAGGVDGDDGPPGVRVGRAVQRRDRQGPRRAGQGERRARGVRRLRDGGGGRAAGGVVQGVAEAGGSDEARMPPLHFVVGHLEAGFRIVPQQRRAGERGRVVSAAGSGADDAAAAGAGDRQLPGAAARATWSCIWRTASAGIAGCGCWRRRAGPRSTWSSSTTAARRSTCRARRSSWCRSTSAARAAQVVARATSAARPGCGRRRRPRRRSPIWRPR